MDRTDDSFEFVVGLISEALHLTLGEKPNRPPMPPTIVVSDSSRLEWLNDVLLAHHSPIRDTFLKSIEFIQKKKFGVDYTRADLRMTCAFGLNKISLKTPSNKLPLHRSRSAFSECCLMASSKLLYRLQLFITFEIPVEVHIILQKLTVPGVKELESDSYSDDDEDLLSPVVLPEPAFLSSTAPTTTTKIPTSNGSRINPINLSSEFTPLRRNPPLSNGVSPCSICLTNIANWQVPLVPPIYFFLLNSIRRTRIAHI